MKTVFANDMVAHIWAQQNQESGRSNNGNFWFENDTLYSYQTPIARIVKTKGGDNAALVNSHKYSVTTEGKHKNAIHRALGYGKLMPDFVVPFLGVYGGHYRGQNFTGKDAHKANLAYLVEIYTTLKEKIKRARDFYNPSHALESAAKNAISYAETFGLKKPELDYMVDASELAVYRAKRDARLNTPEAIAKREKEKERRAERKAAKEDAARKERFEREQIARDEWLNGARNWYRGHDANGGALLRVAGDNLETSQGAAVPIAHAVKAFKFIKLMAERGEAWQRNGHTVRVGHFQIDSIDSAGNIRAGCHVINWPEIERIARVLGIFDKPASAEALESTKAIA